MSRQDILNRVVLLIRSRATAFAGSLFIGLFSLGASFFDKNFNADELVLNYLMYVSLSFLIWEGNSFIYCRLDEGYNWDKNVIRRLILQIALSSIYTAFVTFTIIYLHFNIILHEDPDKSFVYFSVITSIVIALFINAIYLSNYFFRRWKLSLLEAEYLKGESLRSKFDALKNQVNPHFLFNSLNTLTAIIPEDPDLAVEFVQKLANVYRYVLQSKDLETVTLKQELECIDAYLFLLKMRFAENLQVNVNIAPSWYEFSLAPLSLQMLIENAIKHNIASASKPLKIEIYIDEAERLIVANSIQRKQPLEGSRQAGLQNIVKRYLYLSKSNVEIFDTENDFIVKLPLLKVPIK